MKWPHEWVVRPTGSNAARSLGTVAVAWIVGLFCYYLTGLVLAGERWGANELMALGALVAAAATTWALIFNAKQAEAAILSSDTANRTLHATHRPRIRIAEVTADSRSLQVRIENVGLTAAIEVGAVVRGFINDDATEDHRVIELMATVPRVVPISPGCDYELEFEFGEDIGRMAVLSLWFSLEYSEEMRPDERQERHVKITGTPKALRVVGSLPQLLGPREMMDHLTNEARRIIAEARASGRFVDIDDKESEDAADAE